MGLDLLPLAAGRMHECEQRLGCVEAWDRMSEQHMCWLQGLVQWLLRGPGQPLSRQRLIKYLPEICQWEVPCTARLCMSWLQLVL